MARNGPHHGQFVCITDQRRTFVNVYHNGSCWMVQLPRGDQPWSLCKSWGWKFEAVSEPTPDRPGIKRG